MAGNTLFNLSNAIANLDGLLYDIEERRAADQASAKAEGRVFDPAPYDAEQEALIKEALAGNKAEALIKLDNMCAYRQELLAKAAARKSEAKRLTRLGTIGENLAERLRARMKWFLEEQKLMKLETARFKLSIAGNGGKLPIVYANQDDPGKDLPDEFVRIVREPLGNEIYKALKDGKVIPGVALGEAGNHLEIS